MCKLNSKCRHAGYWLAALLLTASLCANAQVKDRINRIKSADPFAVSGTVGAGMGISYNSNHPVSTPFSGNIFASINISFYSFELPISLYFANNTTSFSYPQVPTLHLGFMPTWKNWKFHIGSSSMHFSNYTYSGLTFLGVGAEYQGRRFRMGVFGGNLQQATRLKGYDDRSAIQQLADSLLGLNVPEGSLPQYRRNAVGFRIGGGNERNFIDFSFLKAKDVIRSLPEEWRDTIVAHDNITMGISGRFAIKKWFSFNANIGASLYTQDMRDSLTKLLRKEENIDKVLHNTEWLIALRNNTRLRFAGDAAMNFMARGFNASLTYRFIQPDYVSLGTSNFNQNSHSLGAVVNCPLFKGRSNISLVGYIQRDNMNRKQMYTNQVATYSLNWNNTIGSSFNLNLNYNGIKQDQYDGTCAIADSLRINQMVQTVTVSPCLTIEREHSHSVNLNFNMVQNLNLNKLNLAAANVLTITVGAGYGIDFDAIRLGLDCGYDFSMSSSNYAKYDAHTLNVGLRYKILKKEKTNWTISYNGSFGYNIQKMEGVSNNFSISNSIGSNFSFKKAHTASLYLSLSNFNDREVIGQRIRSDLDCRFTLSYAYSFAAKVVKKMTKAERAEHRMARQAQKLQKKQKSTT